MSAYLPLPNDPICLHFDLPVDRRAAIMPDVRARITLENRAVARTLEHIAQTLEAFASTLDTLELDRACSLSLRTNVLMLTQEELHRFDLRPAAAKDYIESRPAATRGLAGRLEAPTPVSIADAVDAQQWDVLIADRARFAELRPLFSRQLGGLYTHCQSMTIGELSSQLRSLVSFGLDDQRVEYRIAEAA